MPCITERNGEFKTNGMIDKEGTETGERRREGGMRQIDIYENDVE